MKWEKNEVVKETFAYCPICHHKLIYSVQTMELGIPSDNGRYITMDIGEKSTIHARCIRCGYRIEMYKSIDEGITTKEYAENHGLIIENEEIADNPVGTTVEDNL